MALPPCGLYRTTAPLGQDVPAGRLVYFHNHGDPGAGIYTPHTWSNNQAIWHDQGIPIPNEAWAQTLVALPSEGLYRVVESFTCCEKRCRTFEADSLVQLGYTGAAQALLFVPEWAQSGLAIPERGSVIDEARLAKLSPLKVERARQSGPKTMLH